MKFQCLLLLFLTIKSIDGRSSYLLERQYCFADDPAPYEYFGAMMPYPIPESIKTSNTNCKPVQFWILSRHGTRTAKTVLQDAMKKTSSLKAEIIQHYESEERPVNDALCEKDYLSLKNWTWDFTADQRSEVLIAQGWKDILQIAQRYKEKYPDLLGKKYSPEDYYFRYTLTERTKDSCRAFIDGLFGDGFNKNVKMEEPIDSDPVIKPWYMCDQLMHEVEDKVHFIPHKNIFLQSTNFKKLLNDLSNRLGFNEVLTAEWVEAIYDNCRFDKTRSIEKISPWCAVFSKDEMKLMEYYQDLFQYHVSSYGTTYSPKMGCHPLKHLRETFEKTINEGSAKPTTVAMFTHETMLDMMYSALNYSRDEEHLRGNDYDHLLQNRKYRSSIITPFGANFAAILHECPNDSAEKYNVQLFINEIPMDLPGCKGGLCGWNYLQNYLSFTKNCNYDICDNPNTN